jgi:16S rRNA (guanine527-N7)-methyltransferase
MPRRVRPQAGRGEGLAPDLAADPAHIAADRARALALTPVSRETAARLGRYVDLLCHWQKTTNLVAPSTLPELWTRHVADSLQLLRLAPENTRTWVDLGSGGGFPGLAIACALADEPGARVHLVESNAKKCAFLREAIRATGAPAEVHCLRIVDFVALYEDRVEVVSARALAPLHIVLAESAPLLKKGAIGLFPKGQDVEAELTAAAKSWNIGFVVEPSVTSRAGGIVVVRSLEPRSALQHRSPSQRNPGPRRHG